MAASIAEWFEARTYGSKYPSPSVLGSNHARAGHSVAKDKGFSFVTEFPSPTQSWPPQNKWKEYLLKC